MVAVQQTSQAQRVAVVTGGTRGIGLAVAVALQREGTQVIVTGSTPLEADLPAGLDYRQCDVRSADDVESLAKRLNDKYGTVHILVNNAAISSRAALVDTSLLDWTRVLEVNLTGTFLMCRAIVPLMRDGGAIVNISSQAAKRGEAEIVAYAASKAGQLGLTRSLARELAPDIRVNAVCPAVVETELMLRHYDALATLHGTDSETIRAEYLASIPLGRPQSTESIADAVVFLSGRRASEITGQCLSVDGGMVME